MARVPSWTMQCVIGLAGAALVAGACGGKPVGSNVPRPDRGAVAVAAAAAATAATLANPQAARVNAERDEAREPRDVRGNDETVPADVFERAESPSDDDDADAPPCKTAASTPRSQNEKARLELVPTPGEVDKRAPVAPRPTCKDRDDDADTSAEPPRAP